MTIHFCAMCNFETDDEAEAYEHDCIKRSESSDSDQPHVHKLSEAHQWWADCYPQHRGRTNG